MAVPVFTFQLKHEILPGLVTVGKYDGSHSCLTAATTGAKILIHSPHKHDREISFLNVHETVVAICAGKLNPEENKDILVIGTSSSVLAYHVDNNSELFFKEVPDGVTAVAIGNLEEYPSPLLIVGGNCSIQGFDSKGQELYWTVTGDNVTSLAMVDINQDGRNELLAGSDDFEIRVFKKDSIIHQMTETESVISMVGFKENKFAYALANGTVGMYEKLQRLWRIKSPNKIQCLGSYDLDGDGADELITGWSNGRVDARNCRNSEMIFRENLNHGIAGIVCGDYKRAGRNQLIVVTQAGEVRGYDSSSLTRDVNVQADLLRNLFLKKQAMMTELKNYSTMSHPGSLVIPANTSVKVEINPCMGNARFPENHILISVSTNNLMFIRAACVLAEGLFKGETLVVHPPSNRVTSTLEFSLIPPKEAAAEMDVRVFVSSEINSDQFHVFDVHQHLPRFSMYLLIPYNAPEEPLSYVNFQISERTQRLDLWINQNFIAPEVIPVRTTTIFEWCIGIKSLRDGSAVNINYSSGLMTLITENMGLASEIIQSLANYLNVNKLESYARFPKGFEEVETLLSQVKNLQQNASKMSATIADNASVLRSLIVQAEDARIIEHTQDFRNCYTQLLQINDEMLRNHKIYCNNHEELVKILRRINLIIQYASRMRVRKNSGEFISQCRRAVADFNLNVLIKLIETGSN